MTEEQQNRIWATVLIVVALYVGGFLLMYGVPEEPIAFIMSGFVAAFFGWLIGLTVTGADLFIGDYHRIVNRKRDDDDE